jgi:ABC-type phosphate transport system substrate-binding protein
MRMTLRAAFVLYLLFSVAAASAADFVVVVNNENKVTSLSAKDAAALFLKKKTQWPNGTKVVPVVLGDAAAATAAFNKLVMNRSASAVHAFWQQEIFSGRNVPPAEKASDDEVVAFVQKNPGAIGYVSAGASHSGVKVVTVTE